MAWFVVFADNKAHHLLFSASIKLSAHASGSCLASGNMQHGYDICKAYLQDSTGNWGGSLILSTTTAGSTSSSSGQPVDRLTIDSSGLATFTAGRIHRLLSIECVQAK